MANLSGDIDTENANAERANTPTPSGLPMDFGDIFAAVHAESKYYSGAGAKTAGQADFIQKSLDDYAARYGETLPNPLFANVDRSSVKVGDPGPAQYQTAAFAAVRKKFADRAATAGTIPDAAGLGGAPVPTFPTDDQIVAGGVALGRQARSAASEASQGIQGPGAVLGGLTAGLVDGATDPLNALAIAAAPEGGLAIRALGMAGTFGTAEAVRQAETYGFKKTVNPDMSVGEAAGDVAGMAVGGAAFEVGGALAGKLLGAAWRKLVAADPARAAALPPFVHDAGTVAERAADLDANNPFRTGASGEAAHADAVGAIEAATIDGEQLTLPDSAQAEIAKRTGDVFTTTPSSLDVPRAEYDASIRSRAAQLDPDTFVKVQAAEDDIGRLQDRLTEIDGQTGDFAPPASVAAFQSELDDLRAQMGRTTKPNKRAALKSQVDDLQAKVDQFTEGAQAVDQGNKARLAQERVEISNRLAEKKMDRARLGPQVNAATKRAQAEADAIGARPIDETPGQPATDAAPSASGNPFQAQPPQEPPAASIEAPTPVPVPVKKAGKGKRAAPVVEPPPVAPPAPPAPPPAPLGPTSAFYGSGRSVKVKYELAEARDLITSHDADFHKNPAYPEALQPRNRAGKPAQEQVHEILNQLDPERLGPNVEANSGAPIVGPDNVVESGNGRTMALSRAYQRDGAPAYKMFLERSGFDTAGFKEPVLVGRRVTPMNSAEREAFAQAANGSASLRMTPAEQALSDARHIGPDIANLAQRGEITSAANRDFVRAFVAKLSQGERGGMMTADGSLSAAGVDRMRAAMAARAYGDVGVLTRMFDHPEPNIKTIAHALTGAAADWIKMRDAVTAGKIPAGEDFTDALMDATKSIMLARDLGRPIGEVMAQGNMFTSDTSQLAARMFFKNSDMKAFLSKPDMALNLSTFAEDLTTGASKGVDMFGDAPPSAVDTLKGTIAASDRRIAKLIEAAKSSDAIAKAIADPETEDALFAQLDRNIEQGRNKFVDVDADGNPKMGIADAELHDIENQAELAREVRACTKPMMQEAAE